MGQCFLARRSLALPIALVTVSGRATLCGAGVIANFPFESASSPPRYLIRKMRYCSGGIRANTQGKGPHLLE